MLDQRIKFILGILFAVLFLGLVGGQLAVRDPRFVAVTVALCVGGVLVFRGIDVKDLTPFQALYYVMFLIVLVITWTPFKALGYLTPVIFIGGLVAGLATSSDARIMLRLFVILFVWATITLLHMAINPYFVTQNAIISWFTLSAFFPVFLIQPRLIASPHLFQRVMKSLAVMILFQAVYGTIQFAYGAVRIGSLTGVVGDHVEGTIHPQLGPGAGADTAMFICNMAPAALILAAAHYKGLRKCLPPVILGLMTVLMTDRLHVIAIYGVAAAVAFFWLRPRLSRGSTTARVLVACFVALLIAAGLTISGERLGHRSKKFRDAQGGRNEKVRLFETTLQTLPQYHPTALVFGMGPGQFASRASVIAAGYLGTIPYPFKFEMSDSFTMHGLPLWRSYFARAGGSVERPAASWISIIGDFGLPTFLLLTLWTGILLVRIRRAIRNDVDRVTAFFLSACILFLFGIGVADFYWETCQAVFIPMLLCHLLYANLLYGERKTTVPTDPAASMPTAGLTPTGLSAGLALAPRATVGRNGPGPRPRRRQIHEGTVSPRT